MALPANSRRALWPSLTRVEVARGHVIYAMSAKLSHLYFIESGLIGLTKPMRDGRFAEIGAIGCEGIVTPTGVFGADRAAMESIVEIPGTLLRIERGEFRRRTASDADLLALVQTYAGVVMSQLTQTAACNILHSVEERCCRWLLTAHDSAFADRFFITHDFIATLLGVRRASVQLAAAALQKAGLIRYVRGKVTICDRSGLEAAACECYGVIQSELDELFAKHRPQAPMRAIAQS